jgi:ubiquinol-cytochrome c reductase cytochrome c1 subunit
MVRPIGMLAGAGFVLVLLWSLVWGVIAYVPEIGKPTVLNTFELPKHPKENVSWSFEGPGGKYDNRQLQRGFQVYKEVCSACHSLNQVSFRDLEQIGFSKAEVKAIAKNWVVEVPTINPDTGEATTRKAVPADKFPSPYPNETAARAANNNALPPDLSVIVKARHGGSRSHQRTASCTGLPLLPRQPPAAAVRTASRFSAEPVLSSKINRCLAGARRL